MIIFKVLKSMNLFKTFPIVILFMLVCFVTHAQLVYVNGNLITGNTLNDGTPAPTGTFWSEIQPPNNSLGYISNTDVKKSLLDDFIIPSGSYWDISSFICYSHITNYFGTSLPFDSLMIRIYDTDPTASGATPIWGNLNTNRLTGGSFSNIYRTKFNVFDTSRKIWEIRGEIDTILGAGHYWIEWLIGKIPPALSNTFPLNTIAGSTGTPGSNALLHELTSNSFTLLTDPGSTEPQELPFKLMYDSIQPNPCSGIPNPGHTLTNKSFACTGEIINLSIRDTPLVTGSQYQWEYSADSTNWTVAPGATISAFDTSIQNATYYRCKVSCGNNTAYSTPVKIEKHYLNIIKQPTDIVATCSGETYLQLETESSSPKVFYQWQSRDSLGLWLNLQDGPTCKGAYKDSLEWLQVTDSMHGLLFRALVKDVCGGEYQSDSASLEVRPYRPNIVPDSSITCDAAQLLKLEGSQVQVNRYSSVQGAALKNIPDTVRTGISDTLRVSDIPKVSELKAVTVKLHINHPSAGDLAITLKAPNGRIINLLYYLNRSDSGIYLPGFDETVISSNGSKSINEGSSPFNDSYKADLADNKERLGLPAGTSLLLPNTIRWEDMFAAGNGNWILGVYDGRRQNLGQLISWELILTYTSPAMGYWDASPSGSLFSDASANTAYDINVKTDSVFAYADSTANIYVVPALTYCDARIIPDTAFVRILQKLIPAFDSLPDICPGQNLQLPYTSKNNISGSWSPAFDNQKTGTYTFTPNPLTSPCATTIELTIRVIDSCNKSGKEFVLYPNPSTGGNTLLRIFRNQTEGPFEISLSDASGRIIRKYRINGSEKLSIQTAGYGNGVYYLSVRNKNGEQVGAERLLISNN